jgi:putative flippase GtrA
MPSIVAQFSKFSAVGAVNAALNGAIFFGMVSLGYHYVTASLLGWFLGVLNSFVMNKYYTFEAGGTFSIREVVTFFIGYLIQLPLAWLAYAVAIDVLQVGYVAAYIVNLVWLTSLSFLYARGVVFRTGRDPGDGTPA